MEKDLSKREQKRLRQQEKQRITVDKKLQRDAKRGLLEVIGKNEHGETIYKPTPAGMAYYNKVGAGLRKEGTP